MKDETINFQNLHCIALLYNIIFKSSFLYLLFTSYIFQELLKYKRMILWMEDNIIPLLAKKKDK
jgi:hypothetical protein